MNNLYNIKDLTKNDLKRLWNGIVVNPINGCWEWTGTIKDGYGRFFYGGRKLNRRVRVHRMMYAIFMGNVKDNIELDHLCKNKGCCNPFHLEPVSHDENMFRTRKTHCIHGHLLSDKILNRKNRKGERRCLICERLRCKKYRTNHSK